MVKKIMIFLMLITTSIVLAGCGKTISYDQFSENITDVNYFNYLPNSLKNNELIDAANTIDFSNFENIQEFVESFVDGRNNDTSSEGAIVNKSELTGLNSVDFGVAEGTGAMLAYNPLNVVYAKLASANYMLSLANNFNELAQDANLKVGSEGLEVTKDAYKIFDSPEEDFYFEKVTVKATNKDGKFILTVFGELQDINNGPETQTPTTTVADTTVGASSKPIEYETTTTNVDAQLYMKVTMFQNKNKELETQVVVNVNFNVDETYGNNTTSADINFGMAINSVADKSLVINWDTDYTLNQSGETFNLNANDSLQITKGTDTTIEYLVESNEVENESVKFEISANDNLAKIYLYTETLDQEVYEAKVPKQKFNVLIVLDGSSKIVFAGGYGDITVENRRCEYTKNPSTGYSEPVCTTETENILQSMSLIDLRLVNGWDKLRENSYGQADIYNGTTLILGEDNYLERYEDEENRNTPLEANTILYLKTTNQKAAFYAYTKKGISFDIFLPEGLTIANPSITTDLYSNLSNFDVSIDFNNALYQVPELSDSEFFIN